MLTNKAKKYSEKEKINLMALFPFKAETLLALGLGEQCSHVRC